MGIPIGPDTSLVAAEVVLAAVDVSLENEVGRLRGYRYIDDYVLAFPTLAQAENALGALEGLLADYELILNPRKTRIGELPEPLLDAWVGELQTFPIRDSSAQAALSDTVAYFSRAFETARHQTGHGAIRYALQRSRSIDVRPAGWRSFQNLVLTAASSEPTTMPVALDLLNHHGSRLNKRVNRTGLSDLIESLIERNAPLRNGGEVAWAIWAALRFNVDLSAGAATLVSTMEDDLVALLALDAHAKGRFTAGALGTSFWENLASDPDILTSEHWLLAYEGAVRGWLTSSLSQVQAHPFFSVLEGAGVHFYDIAPSRPPFTGPAAPIPGGMLPVGSV